MTEEGVLQGSSLNGSTAAKNRDKQVRVRVSVLIALLHKSLTHP